MSEETLQYLEIVDWDAYMGVEHRKKLSIPYKWIKLPTANIDTHGDLSNSTYGAFNRLLHLAAQTDNCIYFRPDWIKRRTGVTQKTINLLVNRGLIRVVTKNIESENSQRNQQQSSEKSGTKPGASPESGRPIGEGAGGIGSNNGRGTPAASLSLDDGNIFPDSLPGSQRRDKRTFDQLKTQILPVAIKLNTRDPEQIHKLAGQSLRMSPKQCRIAIQQLIEDRKL